MGDEMPLVIVEYISPVVKVLGQIYLFSGLEKSLGFLVHLPKLQELSLASIE
jgi:hypothetical protein